MNRGWRRLMIIGRKWAGRSHGGGGGSSGNCDALEFQGLESGVSALKIIGFKSRSGVPFGLPGNLQIGGLDHFDFIRWENHSVPSFARNYAAPISRVGRATPNPARQQRADPEAPPEPEKPDRKLNRAIVARTIRLIIDDGHEVVSRSEALRRAEQMDLDLVEVDGKQDPPVCKLMDFNKERFKERQREKEMKKKQEPNDLELKAQMAKRLLLKGHRVKIAVISHGSDDLDLKGRDLIQRMVAMLQDTCKIETGPRIEKQRAWALVRPTAIGDRSVSKRKGDYPPKPDSLNEDEADEAGILEDHEEQNKAT
ncbi:hypothetical protein AXG93_1550s1180 [Marchantia polymorpha subsp. ruderalis]|uniref:Translation initiation factor 3 N-terminal domain-containing protein n=1 Tax=Marchantia polymorpha subsp. ruderalis TaxID=1480154 RepID=A0A176WSF7_MARPO|nr:hypothetical protein AXG93_1550s1180 [Marchantia polymorpha subsp. ruderalis]